MKNNQLEKLFSANSTEGNDDELTQKLLEKIEDLEAGQELLHKRMFELEKELLKQKK